jgi:hypothetical protein
VTGTTVATIIAIEVQVAVQDIDGDRIVRRRNIDVVMSAVHPYPLTALHGRATKENAPETKRSTRSTRSGKEAAVTIIPNLLHP